MQGSNDFDVEIRPFAEGDSFLAAEAERISLGAEAWTAAAIKETMSNNGRYFAAYRGGIFLGHAGFTRVLDEGYLTNVAVLPGYRRRGVASALIGYICRLAENEGLSFLSLEVRPSNTAAVKLYTREGFSVCGRRRGFYADPKEDAIIMTRRFK